MLLNAEIHLREASGQKLFSYLKTPPYLSKKHCKLLIMQYNLRKKIHMILYDIFFSDLQREMIIPFLPLLLYYVYPFIMTQHIILHLFENMFVSLLNGTFIKSELIFSYFANKQVHVSHLICQLVFTNNKINLILITALA